MNPRTRTWLVQTPPRHNGSWLVRSSRRLLYSSSASLGSCPGTINRSVPLGIALESYPYPYPVHFFDVEMQGQPLRMAYMDVPPVAQANGKTVVLFHGKNFGGYYWATR